MAVIARDLIIRIGRGDGRPRVSFNDAVGATHHRTSWCMLQPYQDFSCDGFAVSFAAC
jgi:hypothetical protein